MKREKKFSLGSGSENKFKLDKPKPFAHLYDMPEWKKLRASVLRKNKVCYACGCRSDRMDIDHVEAHKGRLELFLKLDNLIPLCSSCHSTVTGRFDRHKEQKLIEKLTWLRDMRIKTNTNVKVYI